MTMSRLFGKKPLLSAALAVSLLAGGSAAASEAGPGLIHNIYIMENGVVLFHLTGDRTTLPTCGTPNPSRWAFDSTTPAGQAKLSFLLTAYTSQKPIAIHGMGTCPQWADTETISHFMIAD